MFCLMSTGTRGYKDVDGMKPKEVSQGCNHNNGQLIGGKISVILLAIGVISFITLTITRILSVAVVRLR